MRRTAARARRVAALALLLGATLRCASTPVAAEPGSECFRFSGAGPDPSTTLDEYSALLPKRPSCGFFLRDDDPPEAQGFWPPEAGWTVVGLRCDVPRDRDLDVRFVAPGFLDSVLGEFRVKPSNGLARIVVAIRADAGKDPRGRPAVTAFAYSMNGSKVVGPILTVPTDATPRLHSGEPARRFAWWPASQPWEKKRPETKAAWREEVVSVVPVALSDSGYAPVLTCEPFVKAGLAEDAFLRVDLRIAPMK